MFDQMKNLKDLTGMLGNPEQMREKIDQIQAELGRKTVEADAGAGAVRVTANGRFEIVNIDLDPSMIAALTGSVGDSATASANASASADTGVGDADQPPPQADEPDAAAQADSQADSDKAMVEELIVAAVNQAMRRAQDMAREEMSKLTGGLNIPGLDQLTGQG